RASGLALLPVRGSPVVLPGVAVPAEELPAELAAVTVSDALTLRALPSAPMPESSSVWTPTLTEAGTTNCPETVPVASGVTVPRLIGSECNTTVTTWHGVVVDVDEVGTVE